MRYIYTLLFFYLLFSFAAKAQSNFKPGYVVNTKQDTVIGFIDYREWVRNPTQVTFRKDMNQPDQKITLENSTAFGVNGIEYYYKATIQASTSSLNPSVVSNGIDTSVTTNTVFLKTLVKGKVLSLYSYNNEYKAHYYIINEITNKIIALNKYVYLNEAKVYVNVNSYINQLLSLAIQYQPNDKNLQPLIARSGYNAGDFTNIVLQLNGEAGLKHTIKHNNGMRFFVGAAVKNNKVSFDGPNFLFVKHSTSTVVPELSAGIDYIPNKNIGVLVFRFELAASQSRFTIADPQSNAVALHSLDFKQTAMSLTPQMLYNVYSTDKLKVFVNAGASFNFYSYNKHSYISKFNNSTENIQEGYPKFKSFQLAVPINVGVEVVKKFQVFAGYVLPAAIHEDAVRTTHISSIQGGVKYLFN
ncbi:hypothetical protein EWM62_14600 [Mucilaginibacter terrigena]|uniref:Outer membrane protein beta-barrel domain-containing protein n=1 Tax=Mucilaginibacter terrigena TaxID=2492395 RepID=A0A4Q5LJR3_9SPHI|nr:hypothetical protein [Mucilaginibacter terrigena]RYU89544.1 hypothetical protein EWM62_14600 [Mucilaginibacter terrigena]